MAKRGPGTARGKLAFSRNAVKHGLRSDAPVIPGFESFEEWEEFRDGIIASYEPEGSLEIELAERIASLLWRLKRAVRWETEMTAHHLDDIPDDLAVSAAYGAKIGIPTEESITMDKIDVMVSRRMLPSKDAMERVIRGACPEQSRARAADVEGNHTFTASGSRRTTSWKPFSPAARESASPLSPASMSAAHRSVKGVALQRPRTPSPAQLGRGSPRSGGVRAS